MHSSNHDVDRSPPRKKNPTLKGKKKNAWHLRHRRRKFMPPNIGSGCIKFVHINLILSKFRYTGGTYWPRGEVRGPNFPRHKEGCSWPMPAKVSNWLSTQRNQREKDSHGIGRGAIDRFVCCKAACPHLHLQPSTALSIPMSLTFFFFYTLTRLL